MVEKIYEAKNQILTRIGKDLSERGVDRMNVTEMGALVDMVKDLAKAEKNCWEAQYYREVVNAMEGKVERGAQPSSRSGYTSEGHVDARDTTGIEEVRSMFQSANAVERERLKKELRSLMGI